MKVIFVGMHNKPNTPVLCALTKSGKLIQRVIDELDLPTLKTNLYDVEYFPTDSDEKVRLANDWHFRINPDPEDIIIVLGAETQKNFLRKGFKMIRLGHPSAVWSNVKKEEYVKRAIRLVAEKR